MAGDASDCRFFRSSSAAEGETRPKPSQILDIGVHDSNQSSFLDILGLADKWSRGTISSGDDAMCGSRRGEKGPVPSRNGQAIY